MSMREATPHEIHRSVQHMEASHRVFRGKSTVVVLQEIEDRLDRLPEAVVCHRCKHQKPVTTSTIKAMINWYWRCPLCQGRGLAAIPMTELFSPHFLILSQKFKVTRR